MLTFRRDVQRKQDFACHDVAGLAAWYESVMNLGLQAVVLHDCVPSALQRVLENDRFKSVFFVAREKQDVGLCVRACVFEYMCVCVSMCMSVRACVCVSESSALRASFSFAFAFFFFVLVLPLESACPIPMDAHTFTGAYTAPTAH